jgi:hypothetical protein
MGAPLDAELARLAAYADLARSAAVARETLAFRDQLRAARAAERRAAAAHAASVEECEALESLATTAAALAMFSEVERRTRVFWSWSSPRLSPWSIRREAGVDRRGRVLVRWVVHGPRLLGHVAALSWNGASMRVLRATAAGAVLGGSIAVWLGAGHVLAPPFPVRFLIGAAFGGVAGGVATLAASVAGILVALGARLAWRRLLPKELRGWWTVWSPRDPLVRPTEIAARAALALAHTAHEARTLVRRAARPDA